MWDFPVLRATLLPIPIMWLCPVQYPHALSRNRRCPDDGLDRLFLNFDVEPEVYENRVGQCRTDVALHFRVRDELMPIDNGQLH
jgi:hypothetical protein